MKRREALRLAAQALFEAGVESARLESEMLLAHILGIARHALYLDPEGEIEEKVSARLEAAIKKRIKGTPIHYLIGEKEFMGLSLYVDERVLIPRFDTEVLCETVLHWLRTNPDRQSLADIGTGSGALAVSLAYYIPGLAVTAVDCSVEALAVARRNAETHGVDDRVTFLQGDLLAPVSRVDAIVSNPPYIPRGEIPGTGEPRLALDGGTDGLDFYRRLAQGSPAVLCSGGLIALETGYDQAGAVMGLLDDTGSFVEIETHPDLSGIPRVVTAMMK